MDLGIRDRRALVTGADSGIGFATARQLLDEGAEVVLTDRDPEALGAAVGELSAFEGRVHGFAADITDAEEVAALAARVDETVGDLDILVNAAGIHGSGGPFHEISQEGWDHTIDVDLMGPVRITRAFLPGLRRGGWGRIVFISSEDAVQPYDDELPYCAAKAGLLALAKGLSRTYASEGVLVNTVSPAFIETPMTDEMMRRRSESLGIPFDEAIRTFLETERPFIELGRRGRAEEVARVIAFLCSDAASFVNGSNYRVDAGSVATI
ncbi:NAD(P)-dependent dehydrogenase (short-subunit alcohol dehydrogenase family) [Brevibacterium sanguinis]|uniref:NAD(P)-dependent dehydrogenase (Short-subunit alcohol dehydrogenase family) n=2 Tax=Brevibacterium TaxID=1696 RepID=A0A366IPX4_9MICO|nr:MULTISPECIES: SDR family oxidoreductase [Brevibacterium]RBP61703.1 NAD(P)-dependent dehydrogenase (short-subunit alcohol dehydrogenase family) [Brevibacterium sanguinis]RBP74316.1 NAD(P)-dependent dehydrogenase (short-subunit alcohol dehydrogenase family) [Brevibacterium celere]